MKIYSWNMLFENKKLDGVFSFIQNLDFDILCLQEVPDTFLAHLEALPVHVASAVDHEFIIPGRHMQTKTVVLSRYPIKSHESFPLVDYNATHPLQGKAFVFLLTFLDIWPPFKSLGNRNGVYADLKTPEGTLRVFSIHLTTSTPEHRMRELQSIFTRLDPSIPSVVCGDFNIFDRYRVSAASWFFGGKLTDVFFPKRERKTVEALFKHHGLVNPLAGMCTHPFSDCQLDHVLVPQSATVTNTKVLPHAHGSDHLPVCVEATIPLH